MFSDFVLFFLVGISIVMLQGILGWLFLEEIVGFAL